MYCPVLFFYYLMTLFKCHSLYRHVTFGIGRCIMFFVLFYTLFFCSVIICHCATNAPAYTERFQYSFFMVVWVMRLNDDIKCLSYYVLFFPVLRCPVVYRNMFYWLNTAIKTHNPKFD